MLHSSTPPRQRGKLVARQAPKHSLVPVCPWKAYAVGGQKLCDRDRSPISDVKQH